MQKIKLSLTLCLFFAWKSPLEGWHGTCLISDEPIAQMQDVTHEKN
jgi:hypothetical protein